MLNKVQLIGFLGVNPEVRYTADGHAITSIRLATNATWKDKAGEKQESVEWHRVVFFGKTAEIVGEHLKKGSLIYVEGRLQTRKWRDKEGQDHYTTEIIAESMKMLPGGHGKAGDAPAQQAVVEEGPF
jgi:single-strand DNA-binding protein